MSENFSTPGIWKSYDKTLVAGTIVVDTQFGEIYEAIVLDQPGETPAGGEQQLDIVAVNGNISAGAGQGDRGMAITMPDAGDLSRIFANIDTLGADEGTSIQFAFADDGTSFTDESAGAKEATDNDMTLLPATPAVDDAYYWGIADSKFKKLTIELGTAGVGTWTLAWEYWDGTAWVDITATDGTSGFTALDAEVTWSIPSDWERTTVNAQSAFWVRARVATYSAVTTQPLGKRSDLGISIILDVNVAGTSIWDTNQENRIHIYDGDAVDYAEALAAIMDTVAFAKGEKITVDADYVALGTAPADLSVYIYGAMDNLGPRANYTVTESGDPSKQLTIESDNLNSVADIRVLVRGRL